TKLLNMALVDKGKLIELISGLLIPIVIWLIHVIPSHSLIAIVVFSRYVMCGLGPQVKHYTVVIASTSLAIVIHVVWHGNASYGFDYTEVFGQSNVPRHPYFDR
ncbi:MAG: hypothetical protein ACKESA_00955, partial [Candidatus Hodgkinia cicadicola]